MLRDVLDPRFALVGDRVELVSEDENGRKGFIRCSAVAWWEHDDVPCHDLCRYRRPLPDLSGTPQWCVVCQCLHEGKHEDTAKKMTKRIPMIGKGVPCLSHVRTGSGTDRALAITDCDGICNAAEGSVENVIATCHFTVVRATTSRL